MGGDGNGKLTVGTALVTKFQVCSPGKYNVKSYLLVLNGVKCFFFDKKIVHSLFYILNIAHN